MDNNRQTNEMESVSLGQQISALEGTLEDICERLSVLEERRRSRMGFLRKTAVGVCVVGVVCVLWQGVLLAQSAKCTDGSLFCFSEQSPVLASEVNHNFGQLRDWIVEKTGDVGDPNVTIAGNLTVAGDNGAVNSISRSNIFAYEWSAAGAGTVDLGPMANRFCALMKVNSGSGDFFCYIQKNPSNDNFQLVVDPVDDAGWIRCQAMCLTWEN
ncbi:MAG: hypothetical protein GY854_34375 [Deltaproteobacteria bacterium]|nr:hypothetical protein [Deltaproteobacteria bacterium]